MMEKYGVEQESRTYEVVVPISGTPDDYKVIGTHLSLPEATRIQNENPQVIIRPE